MADQVTPQPSSINWGYDDQLHAVRDLDSNKIIANIYPSRADADYLGRLIVAAPRMSRLLDRLQTGQLDYADVQQIRALRQFIATPLSS